MLSSCLSLVKMPPAKPAGIADVVDDPDLHVALFGFQRELLEEGEVLRRQVGGRHAAAGLRRDRMEAQVLHGVQVVRQALDGHRAVHAEVGSGPYSDGGVFHASFTSAAVGICTFWKAYFATVDERCAT
jgi:hypothetical protein